MNSVIKNMFSVFLFLVIIEYILSASWYRQYFLYGLIIYKRRISIPNIDAGKIILETLFKHEPIWGNIRIREHSKSELFFREKIPNISMTFMNYPHIMHGSIRYSKKDNSFILVGIVDWYCPAFIILWSAICGSLIIGADLISDRIFLGFFALIPVFVFFIIWRFQLNRYNIIFNSLK